MALIGRESNRFLNKFLPFIIQKQAERDRIKQYLAKSLIEHLSWGQQQKELQRGGYEKNVMEQFLKTGAKGVEDLDRPLIELMYRLKNMGLQFPGMPEITPQAREEAVAPYAALGPPMQKGLMTGEALPEEIMTTIFRLMGTKEGSGYIENLLRAFTGKEERLIDLKELEAGEEKRKLGWAELKERELERKAEERKKDFEYYDYIHESKTKPILTFLQKFITKDGREWKSELVEELIRQYADLEPKKKVQEIMGGPISARNLHKLMSKVSSYDSMARKRKLTDKEEAWLDSVYDLFKMQEEFEPPGEECIDEGQIPAGSRTATNHQTGERVAYVNNAWIKIC